MFRRIVNESSWTVVYYSNAVTPSSDGTISIPLDHVMSKLEVKVTLRNQYGGSGSNPITSAIVFGSATSATYTITEATQWSNKSASSDITPCLSAPYNSTNRIANYEAILIPQNIEASTFGVKVTIGGKSYTWKSANPIQLEGGKKYTLDLTLGKNELTLNTLSVGNWNEETIKDNEADKVAPYVTFTAEISQTFSFSITDNFASELGENEYFEYSVGHGEWVRFKTTIENISFGGTLGSLRLRGKSSKGTARGDFNSSTIQFTNDNSPVDCTGDIRTLIDYENYAEVSTADAKFYVLFKDNKQLRTPPSLPATTLSESCYQEMFSGCTALTKTPALPATTLKDYCYKDMFSGCTALTQVPPTLPATILTQDCYYRMFSGCTQLTQAPELPATRLAGYCYFGMFSGCTQLTQAPELPATTLSVSCYVRMFNNCTALTQAPSLPATTLSESCYQEMFSGCSQLTQAPELPATRLADCCYWEMFSGCSQLTQAPELPATKLAGCCYLQMFSGCSQLSSVTMLATDISADDCLIEWLTNAGTNAGQCTLTLANQDVYNAMCKEEYKVYNYLPDTWKNNVQYKNNQ